MTFAGLLQEYRTEGIGERIYDLIRELCELVARRYPPAIYNSGAPWGDPEFDALSNEVILRQLIERGQLDYIFTTASSLESVRRLVTFQIKRCLVERRHRGPIDRLIPRVRALTGRGQIEMAGHESYRLHGTSAVPEPLSERQVRRCAHVASQVPRLVQRGDTTRESMVYSADALAEVVVLVLNEVGAVSERDLRRIFELLLTPWTPAMLVPVEEDHALTADGADRYVMDNAMSLSLRAFAEGLTDQERTVLVLKSQNVSDSRVAEAIGTSRPTAANVKARLLEQVGEALSDVDPSQHSAAMTILLDHATSLMEQPT